MENEAELGKVSPNCYHFSDEDKRIFRESLVKAGRSQHLSYISDIHIFSNLQISLSALAFPEGRRLRENYGVSLLPDVDVDGIWWPELKTWIYTELLGR